MKFKYSVPADEYEKELEEFLNKAPTIVYFRKSDLLYVEVREERGNPFVCFKVS